MKIIRLAKRGVAAAIIAVIGFTANAVGADSFGNDGIDRSDPNFVTASLLIMSPGNELYSCAGHSCIRLECPTFNLDYCFSYESEGVTDKIFTFLMGKLKMGMFAVPTEDYLKIGRELGRGVMQYRLNLPPDVKQRLWKILDERVAEGYCLPYDYIEHGCAQSIFQVIIQALRPYEMVVSPWPEKYSLWTRREFVAASTGDYPWQQFILYSLCGTATDKMVSKTKNVVMPLDLLEILCMAKVNGELIIVEDGVELLPVKAKDSSCLVTPIVVSCIIVVLAVASWFMKSVWLDWLFLIFQSLAGAFFTYLVAFSSLPATDWNWLIVPFNLLPLIFWYWRRKWALWFVLVLVTWEAGMIIYPHRLTDPAYLVLVGAYILFYLKFVRVRGVKK